MNKKFLSAILFGAMLVTAIGTFVSCKDYDDDIENLQAQINNLATKDDMTAQISSLQSSLSSAASDASAALSDAQAAQTAAQQALADAQAAKTAAEAASDDAAVAKAEAEAATATANEAKAAADAADATATLEAITTLQEQLAELQTKVDAVSESNTAAMDALREELLAAIAEVEKIAGANASNAITSIELVRSYYVDGTGSVDKTITVAIQQANTFATGISNPITFTAGELYQVPAKILVRVSPTNATLTADMIHFVNSQGGTLDDVVEVSKVEPSTTLLTKATSETGLWEVSAQLVGETTQKQLEAVTKTKVNNVSVDVLFAIQANNTIDGDSARYITSSYDLTFAYGDYTPDDELYYYVDKTCVTDINNRYENAGNGSNPSLPYTTDEITYIEETWAASTTTYPTPAVAPIVSYNNDGTINTSKSNVIDAVNVDDRSTLALYPAVQGQAITISLKEKELDERGDWTGNYVDAENIRALYVTLDFEENAIESAPSEWNAWNSYSYTGLNTVVEDTSTKITINNANGVINDIIGFRVYAVNYDGTLVDPDGKAFYVSVGDTAIDWNAAATTITPTSAAVLTTVSTSASVSLSKLEGIDHATWVTDKLSNSTDIFTAHFFNGNTEAFSTDDDLTTTALTYDLTKITAVKTTINLTDWTLYKDDTAYTGTLTYYDATGHVLATIKVTMTKVLPTGLPDGFSIKTNQVTDGIYYGFLVPSSDEDGTEAWAATTASYGTMGMDEIFNYGTGNASSYIITWGTSDSTGKKDQVVAGDGTLAVVKSLVDNKTYHTTTVGYNYGNISSDSKKNGDDGYTVTGETFQSIYVSIYYEKAYTWSWATEADMVKAGYTFTTDEDTGEVTVTTLDGEEFEYPYSTEITYGNTGQSVDGHFIFGTSLKDSRYNATGANAPYESSLGNWSATLTSDSNGLAEYFTVEIDGTTLTFVPTESQNTNPVGDVASTLTITCYDSYSNKVTIKLPMTVKERK